MSERTTKPRHAITLTSYAELWQFAEAFGSGKLNLLILVGTAGIAKSQTMRQVVGERALWIEGNATAFGIYQAVYEHRDKPIVIDDVDTLYTDRAAVRLLKCLCQTDPVKQIAWYSNAAGVGDLPRVVEDRRRITSGSGGFARRWTLRGFVWSCRGHGQGSGRGFGWWAERGSVKKKPPTKQR